MPEVLVHSEPTNQDELPTKPQAEQDPQMQNTSTKRTISEISTPPQTPEIETFQKPDSKILKKPKPNTKGEGESSIECNLRNKCSKILQTSLYWTFNKPQTSLKTYMDLPIHSV
ncbi:hypothetical protein JTB14_002752 [Gonioctena quinquepunctata]|nr:hypothetical protein JTB14_002752 [Gonioctena quinquepunctata]